MGEIDEGGGRVYKLLVINYKFWGSQSWVFIGRNDVEAETPVLWPPDAKS